MAVDAVGSDAGAVLFAVAGEAAALHPSGTASACHPARAGDAAPHRVDELRQPALMVGTLATAVLFALTALLLMRARSLFVSSYEAMTTLACQRSSPGRRRSRGWRCEVLEARAGGDGVGVRHLVAGAAVRRPLRRPPGTVERMVRLLGAYRVNNEPTGVCNVFVRNLVFYAQPGWKAICAGSICRGQSGSCSRRTAFPGGGGK